MRRVVVSALAFSLCCLLAPACTAAAQAPAVEWAQHSQQRPASPPLAPSPLRFRNIWLRDLERR
jgi:hypothetical protein